MTLKEIGLIAYITAVFCLVSVLFVRALLVRKLIRELQEVIPHFEKPVTVIGVLILLHRIGKMRNTLPSQIQGCHRVYRKLNAASIALLAIVMAFPFFAYRIFE